MWKPEEAIPALGTAMCDLEAQLGHLDGADPYRLALTAYQWGEAATRAANGVPQVNVPQLADATLRYLPTYEKDTRLSGGATPASPAPSASPSTGAPVSSSPTPDPETTSVTPSPAGTSPATTAPTTSDPEPDPTTAAPTSIGGYAVGKNYKILNDWTNEVAELPDKDSNKTVGAHVQLWEKRDQKDQYWTLTAAPDSGYIVFVNAYSGLAMGVEPGGTWNGAKILQVKLNPSDKYQQWKLEYAGYSRLHLRNHATGKLLDILGTDKGPESDGTWNGHWVEQWDQADTERDQRWSLIS